MPLSLTETQALNAVAEAMYGFLPGKPHPYGNRALSIPAVADELGLTRFWPGGSKKQAIAALLASTMEHRRDQLCPLVHRIVQRGLTYRQFKGNPIVRDEIEYLNRMTFSAGFIVAELSNARFLATLPDKVAPGPAATGAPSRATSAAVANSPATSESVRRNDLAVERYSELKVGLESLMKLAPTPRGYAFESFLSDFFDAFSLAPRGAFRLVGEQIDGSFECRQEVYLLEAKWQNDRVGDRELLALNARVDRKSKWARGLFVSYAGFSDVGLEAFQQTKDKCVVGCEGQDLWETLNRRIDFAEVIRRKVRAAAETGRSFVPVRELF